MFMHYFTAIFVDYVWTFYIFVNTIQKIVHFSDDFYSDGTLMLTKIAVN
jgi:hypothetical protein